MNNIFKKLIPFIICLTITLGNCLSILADGGSVTYSKLYIKNGSGVYENSTSNVITLKNYPTKVVIKRTDVEENVDISGSHLSIINSNNEEVISFITTDKPKSLDGVLSAGTYILRETSPAYGHTPEVTEKEIIIQDTTSEQVFIIRDKEDDENGYWQLFNSQYNLKSSVKKETEITEVSSGERSFSIVSASYSS